MPDGQATNTGDKKTDLDGGQILKEVADHQQLHH